MNTASAPTSNAPGGHRAGGDEQHEAEPDVGGALGERLHAVVEHAVAHGRVAAGVDERAQVERVVWVLAPFTFTVVAAAITSPRKPLTAPAASRSAAR